jgi:hypothetical protein
MIDKDITITRGAIELSGFKGEIYGIDWRMA